MKATEEALTEFINSERDRFAARESNLLGFAFMKVPRTCGFLDIILGRYEEVSAAFLENTNKLF